ncbi:MAG: HK97 gp10 family phage protein [Pseudolysinimonas sp.]
MAEGVKFNEEFFQQLSRSPAVTALVVGVAQQIAADARSTAPVDTGAYRDGIEVHVKQQKRSVALVVGTDKKTMLVESKTGNLARALQRAKKRGRG